MKTSIKENWLHRGDKITVEVPWSDAPVEADVLNVEAVELNHTKHRSVNFVTLYGGGCLFTAEYYGDFIWRKDENNKPYSTWEYTELEGWQLLATEVTIKNLMFR